MLFLIGTWHLTNKGLTFLYLYFRFLREGLRNILVHYFHSFFTLQLHALAI